MLQAAAAALPQGPHDPQELSRSFSEWARWKAQNAADTPGHTIGHTVTEITSSHQLDSQPGLHPGLRALPPGIPISQGNNDLNNRRPVSSGAAAAALPPLRVPTASSHTFSHNQSHHLSHNLPAPRKLPHGGLDDNSHALRHVQNAALEPWDPNHSMRVHALENAGQMRSHAATSAHARRMHGHACAAQLPRSRSADCCPAHECSMQAPGRFCDCARCQGLVEVSQQLPRVAFACDAAPCMHGHACRGCAVCWACVSGAEKRCQSAGALPV
jgi:hypothetical protein